MKLRRTVPVLVSICVALTAGGILAEGKGHGLNRALSAAARGSGSSGLSRAGQSVSRSANGLSRSGSSLGRSGNGMSRAASGMSHSQSLAAQSDNAARIRDKRFQQAEHLREVSARNGNERLLDTAGRMEESAQTNYDRRVGDAAPAGQSVPTDSIDDAGADEADGATGAPAPAPSAKSRRPSWLPSWLGGPR